MEAKVGFEPTFTALQTVAFFPSATSPSRKALFLTRDERTVFRAAPVVPGRELRTAHLEDANAKHLTLSARIRAIVKPPPQAQDDFRAGVAQQQERDPSPIEI